MTSLAKIAGTRYWRTAWFAVWSPFVAWVGAIALLWVSGPEVLPWPFLTVTGCVIAVCGLLGLFVVVPETLGACIDAQDQTGVGGGERFRLFLLGLVGTVVGLVGFGCLVLFGALVMFLSPMKGFQTPG